MIRNPHVEVPECRPGGKVGRDRGPPPPPGRCTPPSGASGAGRGGREGRGRPRDPRSAPRSRASDWPDCWTGDCRARPQAGGRTLSVVSKADDSRWCPASWPPAVSPGAPGTSQPSGSQSWLRSPASGDPLKELFITESLCFEVLQWIRKDLRDLCK